MNNKAIWCILVVMGSLIALQSCESKKQGGRSGGGGASGSWEEQKRMSVKSDLIEKLRETPGGVLNFLLTPLIEAPGQEYPTTKDDAIIVQGVLAAFLLNALKPFAGLTPIEMIMRVGQHSNPLETITLSILEYIDASNAEKAFTIEEPTEGQSLAAGDIRIIVKAKGKISSIQALTNVGAGYDPQTPETQITDLTSTDGEAFYGYIRIDHNGSYTTVVTATYDDKDQTVKTASVHFSVADDGDIQSDLAEFNLAAKKVEDSADSLFDMAITAAKTVALEMAAKALFTALLAL